MKAGSKVLCLCGLAVLVSACSDDAVSTGLEDVPCFHEVVVRDGEISNNIAPFGGTTDQRYQQIYSASATGDGGQIVALEFLSPGQPDIALVGADYRLSLETTGITMTGLSQDMDVNLGPGAVTVFDERLEGHRYSDTLTFELTSPYVFDPGAGNLLLDVQITNAIDDGSGVRVFEAMRNSEVVSRRPAYGGVGDGFGLVTVFVLDSGACSAP